MANKKYAINFEMTDGSVKSVELDIPVGVSYEEFEQVKKQIADQNGRIAEAVDTEIENEKGNIVNLLIAELQGLPVFGVVDANNNITVTSQLSSGTYTLKYENEDGTLTDVGTITIEEGEVPIINLLSTALTPDDIITVFDGIGYKNGYYASAAEPYYNTDTAFFCTGLMPIPADGNFYIKGCTMDTSLSHTRFGLMNEAGVSMNTQTLANWGTAGSDIVTFTELGEQYYQVWVNPDYHVSGNYVHYFYFSASGTGDDVIVSHTPIE